MKRMVIWLLAGWIVGVSGVLGAEFEVKLSAQEPAGLDRVQCPVSGGIPLPEGLFKKSQSFAVFNGAEEVPAQVLPLVTTPEGALRWVLVDLLWDLKAGERKEFTLKAVQPKARPAAELKVSDEAAGVTVDTGKIRFFISRTGPFSLLSRVEAGGKELFSGGEVAYTDGFDGKRYTAEKPAEMTVEYAGPVRTTVCIRGGFAGDTSTRARYIARITAWAGRSDVQVKYKLSNSNPDHYCYRALKESAIVLKPAGRIAGTTLGVGKPVEAGEEGWLASGLRSGTAGCAKAGDAGKELWTSAGKGDTADGWLAIRSEAGAAWVCDLYFSEDPARRLSASGGVLTLAGVIERWKGVVDDKGREAGAPYAATARWFHDCSHLSSHYVLDFAPTGTAAGWTAAARAARALPHLAPPPAWYFQTEQVHVGRFGTQEDELKCYEIWDWKHDKTKAPRAPGNSMGRYVRGEDNHFESEHDNLDSLALMYLRTGSRAFFDAALAMGNYYMDLQSWRTDGWLYKDGGVWWRTGPMGNRPQRTVDPVTGTRNDIPAGWSKTYKAPWTRELATDAYYNGNSKACHCHNWGEGVTVWYCLTGDRDALEAAVDCVEQNYDTQRRAFGQAPGVEKKNFSRDFTRSSYLANATRLVAPDNAFVVEASDYLAQVFFGRPTREPRGMVNGRYVHWAETNLEKLVGPKGVEAGQAAGVTFDPKTATVTHKESGRKWPSLPGPNTWMYPPLSRAMGLYYRLTGNEDAMDWLIAYGKMAAYVMWQEKHGQQHGSMLADWPAKGVVKDYASWNLPDDAKDGEGMKISGYLAKFLPDVCARAYVLSGEPFLRQRAFDYWDKGSHRGYQATKLSKVGEVAEWVNHYGPHNESVCFTGVMFREWAHPRGDTQPPRPVGDLTVKAEGEAWVVTFTAPGDEGGGDVVRYQVKCSDKPIVDYADFLKLFNAAKDEEQAVCNWWMAANLQGEPKPQAGGVRERFVVTGVPVGAKYFAVRSFDHSSNRSALSNVAEAGK